jgi:ABC-2 type transport system ATP-binding protein
MVDRDLAIVAKGLRKQYGKAAPALDGFDLKVPYGRVHGLLGPNGAGKSTAVRILTTLLRPDGGTASVAGLDVFSQQREVRQRIGLVGQHAAVDEILSGRQNLVLFGRLFHLTPTRARQRADELLEQFELTDAANRPAKSYSGGMRRRLDLAASLIMAPPVLFLDEPTTGLDPRSRIDVWNSVRTLVREGTSVLLATQYLDEADQLAGRITVINKGKGIAEGSPIELKRQIGGDRIEVVASRAEDVLRLNDLLRRITGNQPDVDLVARRVSAPVAGAKAALTDAFAAITAENIPVEDLGLRRPTLDEVFLHLTGISAESSSEAEEVAA